MAIKYYEKMPVVPLRGLVVMPYTLLSFDAGRDKSVAAIETAAENDGLVFLTAQKDPKLTDITAKQLYEIGCICKIKQVCACSRFVSLVRTPFGRPSDWVSQAHATPCESFCLRPLNI